MSKKKNKEEDKKPKVHDDLKGFDMKINEFGEIVSNLEIEKINTFLDENVEDKKFKDRQDAESKDEEE